MNRLPDRSSLRPLRRRPARLLLNLAKLRHVLHRNLNLQLQQLPSPSIDHRHRTIPRSTRFPLRLFLAFTCNFHQHTGGLGLRLFHSAFFCAFFSYIITRIRTTQKTGHLLQRPLRRRQPDPLQPSPRQRLQPLQRQRHMRPTLRWNQRMNLIHNHRLDRPQPLSGLRCQQQIQALRCRYQNIARMSPEPRPLFLRSIPRAHADPRHPHRDALPLRHIRNTHQRRSQVALHIRRQRLQRRDVDHPASFRRIWSSPQHQSVETPQKRSQRLTRPRRRQN